MSSIGNVIRDWWKDSLQVVEGDLRNGRKKALRAKLRRASLIEALCEHEVHGLATSLKWDVEHAVEIARLVRLLAEVRVDDKRMSLPAKLGESVGTAERTHRTFSEMRFQRLMRSTPDELSDALRRALGLVKYTCDVGALGADILGWQVDKDGERIRVKWCFDYFDDQARAKLNEEILQ